MGRNSAIELADGLKLSSLKGKDRRSQVTAIVRARIRQIELVARKLEEERKTLKLLVASDRSKP